MPNISRFLFFPLSLSVCLAAKTIYRRTLRTYEISNTAIKLKMNNKRNKFSFTNASTSRPICCRIESRECEKVTCSLDCAENTEYGARQKGRTGEWWSNAWIRVEGVRKLEIKWTYATHTDTHTIQVDFEYFPFHIQIGRLVITRFFLCQLICIRFKIRV